MNRYFFKKQAINRMILHILFWLLSFFIFSYIFKISDEVSRIDYIFSGLFHVSLIIAVYINLALLMPLLFNKKRYIVYSFALATAILLSILLNLFTFNRLADIFLPGYYFVSHFEFWDVGFFIVIYILVTSLLKLSKSWFELQETNNKLDRIEKENIKSELNTLKAQINPHFLFNSLNVIYSQAIKGSNKTPEAVIQLADILRYVIYDSTNDKVLLNTEIKLLEDYIELHKFRIESSSRITFEHHAQNDNYTIAPMLLLPLVENSFKHGIKGDLDNTFVNIKVEAIENNILFEIENSKGSDENEAHGGIGLANIRQRLNLLYPNKHKFTIEESATRFKVKMVLTYES
jgi:sensor histidine kinase YesM